METCNFLKILQGNFRFFKILSNFSRKSGQNFRKWICRESEFFKNLCQKINGNLQFFVNFHELLEFFIYEDNFNNN